jgi:release factor glutamine methyltransferase
MTNNHVADALRNAALMLSDVSETARLDAELLMAYALNMPRSDMVLQARDLMVPESYAALVGRRVRHEPVAYITGRQAFWDLELMVTPDVLIPRADSETLIEAAEEAFEGREPKRILDLGTGSGALLLAALSLFRGATGIGVDASANALSVARANAEQLGFTPRSAFLHLSWRDAGWAQALNGPFDLILCNPPYVETTAQLAPMVAQYEPHTALFSGEQGLDDYRILIPYIPALLSPGGIALFEIGHQQAQDVSALALQSQLSSILRHDLAGNPRCLSMRHG